MKEYKKIIKRYSDKLVQTLDIRDIIVSKRDLEKLKDNYSELKVAIKLQNNVDCIEKIKSENYNEPIPDFKILIENVTIFIEVKRIRDKLDLRPSEMEIDDISTIGYAISKGKNQYKKGFPFLIVLDCSSLIYPDEFEDKFYVKSREPTTIREGEKDRPNYKVFSEIEPERHLSGIIGIFENQWIFFNNPFALKDIIIDDKIFKKLGIEIYPIQD
jgi:hypothetical protein